MTKPDFMVMVPDLYRRRRRRQGQRHLPRHPPEPQGHLFCAHLLLEICQYTFAIRTFAFWTFAIRTFAFWTFAIGHLPFGHFSFCKKPPEGEVLDYMGKTFEGDFCGTS